MNTGAVWDVMNEPDLSTAKLKAAAYGLNWNFALMYWWCKAKNERLWREGLRREVSNPHAETEKKTADAGTGREMAQGDGGENERA